MPDPNEIGALKASFRGATATAEALAACTGRIEALTPAADVSPELLAELARVATAHAVASNALRGFVETMIRRRAGHA